MDIDVALAAAMAGNTETTYAAQYSVNVSTAVTAGTAGDLSGTPTSGNQSLPIADLNDGLTNTGNNPITIQYTFTPTGVSDAGACNGTPQTVDVVIEPQPEMTASGTNVQGNPTADYTQVICDNANPNIAFNSVTNPSTGSVEYVIQSATPSSGNVSSALSANDIVTGINETLDNTGNDQETVTYVVRPRLTNDNNCDGDDVTIIVTVNPTPVVTTNQTSDDVCSSETNSAIELTSTNEDGITEFIITDQTNDNTEALTGAALNLGTWNGTAILVPVPDLDDENDDGIVTYEITPRITEGGETCDGTPETVTINIGAGVVFEATPAAQVICNDDQPTITITETDTDFAANDADGVDIVLVSVTENGGTSNVDGQSPPGIISNNNASGTHIFSESILTNDAGEPRTLTYTFRIDRQVGANCVSEEETATVTVSPTPIATDPVDETICHNMVPATVIDLTAPSTGGRFVITAVTNDDGVGGVATVGDTGADGDLLEDGTLTNTGTTAATVQYTVRPYTFGADGNDDNGNVVASDGNQDDCLGTAFMVNITVLPNPVATEPSDETVCSGDTPITKIDVTAPTTNGRFIITNVVTSNNDGGVSGQATANQTFVDNALLEDGALTNLGDEDETVTYTVRPYSLAPDGNDDSGNTVDSGDGILDDCLGTAFDVIITIQPDPIAQSSVATQTICSGDSPTVTVSSPTKRPTTKDSG
jgi:hypothetical protein